MKIKKIAPAKSESTLQPSIREFISTATSLPTSDLLPHLATYPAEWPFPRGDLYHWVPLLNRFDDLLEEQVNKYKLKDGPQTLPWQPEDKALVVEVLKFSKLLVENCSNRSLYGSSSHINDLLNTTDIDVLIACLSLGVRLGQRYYTSRTKGTSTSNSALLTSHYNINLERVAKLAAPFVKSVAIAASPVAGKNISTKAVLPVYATDLTRLARDQKPITDAGVGKGKAKATESKEGNWEEWGGAWVSYYVNPTANKTTTVPPPVATFVPNKEPTTPTPVRRTHSHHGHPAPSTGKKGRAGEEAAAEHVDTTTAGGLHTLEISYGRIKSAANLEEILKATLPDLPADCHYEFLHRLRVAAALAGSLETRRKVLAVRILAITNLAYVHSENQFQTKVLALDQDEPRRQQLVFQLADLLQSSDGKKGGEVPRWIQTIAVGALEALARHRTRSIDVCTALSAHVNHGVLLYLVRKTVAELSVDDGEYVFDRQTEEWRDALWSLVSYLPSIANAGVNSGGMLVSAGLISILVEHLQIRNQKAIRHIPKIINFLDQLLYQVASAFQAFANAKGLDVLVDLVSHEVKSGIEEVKQGHGIPQEYKTQQTDYKINHYRQQTLKAAFKFMRNLMQQSGGNADRLLRNLIDNPDLLGALKLVISRGDIWGSNVWHLAMSLVSTFIHNEPTSYAVVHEAGVTHAFLESVTCRKGLAEEEARRKAEQQKKGDEVTAVSAVTAPQDPSPAAATASDTPEASEEGASRPTESGEGSSRPAEPAEPAGPEDPKAEKPLQPRLHPLAEGIMPTSEAISAIPNAFGAICLNASGLALLQASGALETYFEIFESSEHVKQLADGDLANMLGNNFDELVRHHPVLRDGVLRATLETVRRISELGHKFAVEKGMGAKVWLNDGSGGLVVAGGRRALVGGESATRNPSTSAATEDNGKQTDEDVKMKDADQGVLVGEPLPDGSFENEVVTLADIVDEESEDVKDKIPTITDYIDVLTHFLEGYLANAPQAKEFIKQGGLDNLLGFYRLPSLPHDFATSPANQMLCRVVQLCCEHSLVDSLKTVFVSAREAMDELEPLLKYDRKAAYFAPLTSPNAATAAVAPPRLQGGVPPTSGLEVTDDEHVASPEDSEAEAEKQAIANVKFNGTILVKKLVTIHSLCYLLQDLYHVSMFNVRQSIPVLLSINQDMEKDGLIAKLGALQRLCVWEEILLQNGIPDTWNEATKVKDSAAATAAAIEEVAVPQTGAASAGGLAREEPKNADEQKKEQKEKAEKEAVERDGKTSWFRNVKTIRYLISQIPNQINPFLQGLAKCVISRRSTDSSQKSQALKLVDSIAESMRTHLTFERLETSDSLKDKYSYWIVMLTSVTALLLEGLAPDFFLTPKNSSTERQPTVILTSLITFKQKDGIQILKNILRLFWSDLKVMPDISEMNKSSSDDQQKMAHAYGGIKIILSLFAHLVSPKSIIDSAQTTALHNRSIGDFPRADYFNVHQLLVELRHDILPVVEEMWEAPEIEKASSSVVKSVVEILAIILKAEGETGAFTKRDVEKKPGLKNTLSWDSIIPRQDHVNTLVEMGFSRLDATNALLRTNENMPEAAHWLTSMQSDDNRSIPSLTHLPPNRTPPDFGGDNEEDDDDNVDDDDDGTDIDAAIYRHMSIARPAEGATDHPEAPAGESASAQPGAPAATADSSAADVPSGNESAPVPAEDAPALGNDSMNIDTAPPAGTVPISVGSSIPEGVAAPPAEEKGKAKEVEPEEPKVLALTVEDLDAVRAEVRDHIINRSLDVLQVHTDITFELADLIKCAFHGGSGDTRREVGSTIVQSLMSLQMDDDFRPKAKTIASTAHLLGLILQDKNFYEACMEDLAEQLSVLVGFIKIYPGEPAPWVANILLVVERLLSENAQPRKVKFVPPGESESPDMIAETAGFTVSDEDQESLFDAILAIVPHIEKDDLLPLSVARILVLLTRRRKLAVKLMEKGNLQKVFRMVRRQAGNRNDRVKPLILLILRHVIEDEETLRKIMRSDIRLQFLNKPSRPMETNQFLKLNAQLVIRNPEIFVEVVNELCKLTRYDPHLRNQHLSLKQSERQALPSQEEGSSQDNAASSKAEADFAKGDAKAEDGTEGVSDVKPEGKEAPERPRVITELKAPGVEKPDGVIHFLIAELFACKDVEDAVPPPEAKKEDTKIGSSADVSMDDNDVAAKAVTESTSEASGKPEKPEFKAEQHSVYLYRCFLLQILTELLSCYNRCKVEFINYSRKANPRDPITPSKPRSAIFSYLLHDLIPLNSLTPAEDIPSKKKAVTSQWAVLTLTSLTAHTGEIPSNEEEPDLLFVRKFVLESALKAFKDAYSSSEVLDLKYAKLLNLSDLFYRMLSTRPNAPHYPPSTPGHENPHLQIAKIMLEKGYIAALTGALADIDLNFPSSRRVIKYMLKPFKILSKTASELPDASSISSSVGSNDEDEISTATSVSDDEDNIREETPDLYRNSTLGMFNAGEMVHDDEASSYGEEDEDEEMYDEDMEFEEDVDDDENGSDLSEEIEGDEGGDNMDVEIVVEGDDPDDDSDSDEDDEGSDMEDDEGEIEIIDDLGGAHDDEYGSGGDDWHSEGSDGEHEEEEDEEAIIAETPLENIVRTFGGGLPEDAAQIEIDDDDREDGYIDDEGDDDEDVDADEDDEDLDEDDAMLADEYDDDEGAFSAPWGWADGGDVPVMTRAQPRGIGGWFTLSGAAPREPPVFMSRATRPVSHRYIGGAGDRAPNNQEQNPLLQQDEAGPSRHVPQRHPEIVTEWAQAIDGMHAGGPGGAVSMISTLMNLMSRSGHGLSGGNIQFQATMPHPRGHHFHHHHGPIPREIRSMFGSYPRTVEAPRHHREDPATVVNSFVPTLTNGRWVEEARLLFGSTYPEVAQRIVNSILVRLVPPAVEEERVRKEKEEEERKEAQRLADERKAKEEEERLIKEKAEAEEKAKKEAEEKEAAERAAAEAASRAAELATVGDVEAETSVPDAPGTEDDAMEGIEATTTSAPAEGGPSEPAPPRATVMIRGQEMDITGMGIDPEFLEAIPDDMREEVLTNHIRERRAEAAAANTQPSEISPEFLEALPAEIREELVAAEAADRRRREQETNRPTGGPSDMDLATFLASLDPSLREQVLLEQDETVLAGLPQAFAEEANALREDRRYAHRFVDVGIPPRAPGLRQVDVPKPVKKPVKKGTIQLLDKAGVATLLRLMFIPQIGSPRQTLHDILLAVCENKQNRLEVVNLLLSILQDGCADMIAVERSFAQLSIRAKQPPIAKTPVTPGLKRTNTSTNLLAQTSGEISPLIVTQQCLSALLHLVQFSTHVPGLFLSPTEIPPGLKRSLSRRSGKGKAPESESSKYALNSLLTLLDRSLITESSTVMDQFSILLSEITRPLMMLAKKKKMEEEKAAQEKAAQEKEKAAKEAIVAAESSKEPGAPDVNMQAEPSEKPEPPKTDDEKEKSDSKDKNDKSRSSISPPVVPEHNLRLVVNILTARECSSKTYRETLATMQNLSGLTGAKDVFGTELIRQAQDLGVTIQEQLDELLEQIKVAETGTDVQGMALSNFSPASSDQAKLLRVLTALDYLFDPKRSAKEPANTEGTDGESKPRDDSQTLEHLYEKLTFGPLWSKLSDCLKAIHERSDMLHVATILLPLIESLMVVCRNSGMKEEPKRPGKAGSPELVSPMQQLFFSFTEDHRKILNQMVRNNPKLMSGSFALLVNNPKVLDFDNKRNYFNRRLHTRTGSRDAHPTLQLSVRRDQVFLDSYKAMYFKSGDEIKFAKMSIRFHGEEGVDAGGVTREWFQVMARQMFNPDYALFVPVAGDRTTFHPNRMSHVNPEHLDFFKFIGRVIGKALYEGRVLDCHFSRALYKKILGRQLSVKDMEATDLEYYKSLDWMQNNDITDIVEETFSQEIDEFGAKKIVDLIDDGRHVPVTEENKHEYIRVVVQHRLLDSVKDQIDHFLTGFHDIVPKELISIFNEQELELLISGMPEIDVEDWRNNTEYHNYSASSPQILWFWRAVRSFDKEERAKLLQFCSGSARVPLNGFRELEGMSGRTLFNIHRDFGSNDRLPSAHTCFNQLDLPCYESYDELRKQLLTAITAGGEYFGFA